MRRYKELLKTMREKRFVIDIANNLRACVNRKSLSHVLSDEEKLKVEEVENIFRNASDKMK